MMPRINLSWKNAAIGFVISYLVAPRAVSFIGMVLYTTVHVAVYSAESFGKVNAWVNRRGGAFSPPEEMANWSTASMMQGEASAWMDYGYDTYYAGMCGILGKEHDPIADVCFSPTVRLAEIMKKD